jgi:hypothetical protein
MYCYRICGKGLSQVIFPDNQVIFTIDRDVLNSKTITLEWETKLKMVTDAARGLNI